MLIKEPDNEKIYFNLGMLGMDDHEFNNAETWFRKAIEVSLNYSMFTIVYCLNKKITIVYSNVVDTYG